MNILSPSNGEVLTTHDTSTSCVEILRRDTIDENRKGKVLHSVGLRPVSDIIQHTEYFRLRGTNLESTRDVLHIMKYFASGLYARHSQPSASHSEVLCFEIIKQ